MKVHTLNNEELELNLDLVVTSRKTGNNYYLLLKNGDKITIKEDVFAEHVDDKNYKVKTLESINGNTYDINTNNIVWSKQQLNNMYYLLFSSGDLMSIFNDPFDPTPPIPKEYEELEFIELNGDCNTDSGQYLKTNFPAKSTSKYILIGEFTNGTTGTSIYQGAKSIFDFGETVQQGKVNIMYCEYCHSHQDESTFTITPGIHTYVIDYINKIISYDDEVKSFKQGVDIKYSTDLPFLIGAWYENNKAYYRLTGKVKRFEVWEGNEQKVALVPVMYKDGTVGMYDAQRKVFLTNQGTGTLGYKKKDGTYVAPTK